MADAAPENGTHFTIRIMPDPTGRPTCGPWQTTCPHLRQQAPSPTVFKIRSGNVARIWNMVEILLVQMGLGWDGPLPPLGCLPLLGTIRGALFCITSEPQRKHVIKAVEFARREEKSEARRHTNGCTLGMRCFCQEIGLCPMQRCWMQETPKQKRCLCTVMLVRRLLKFGSSVEQLSTVLCTTWDEPCNVLGHR